MDSNNFCIASTDGGSTDTRSDEAEKEGAEAAIAAAGEAAGAGDESLDARRADTFRLSDPEQAGMALPSEGSSVAAGRGLQGRVSARRLREAAGAAVDFSGGGDGGVPVGLGTVTARGGDQGQRQWVRRRALQGITEELGELKARIARMRVSHFSAFFFVHVLPW